MALIIILFAFIGWQDKTSQMMIAIIPIFTLLTISLFNYDQSAHFETYAMTLPISPATYVLEKFIFGIALSFIATCIAVGLLFTKGLILPLESEFIWQAPLLGMLISLVLLTLSLPLFFKLPVEIARTYFIAFILILSFGGSFVASKITLPQISFSQLILVLVLIILGLMSASYFISLTILKNKFN